MTCPAFVEIDGTVQLVLTTAMEGMPEDQFAKNPAAGALFVAETAYPSLTVRPPLVRVTPPN